MKSVFGNLTLTMTDQNTKGIPKGSEVLSYDDEAEKRELKYGINYKWIVLSNTTLGALMAAIDGSIVLISLPAIFSGLGC